MQKLIQTFALSLLLLLAQACSDSVADMDQQTALKRIQANDITIIDVRTEQEFAAGHVPSAINIPYDQLDQHQDKLAGLDNKPVLLYCKSGHRAGIAKTTLTEKGFQQLYHLDGDMQGWVSSNLPIEK